MQDTYKIELFTYDANGQQNGYAVYNSPTGWHDWTIRTLTLTPTSDVASYKVSLTGFDGGYWYGVYGPAMRTPTLSATVTTTTTTYQEVTTYEEVTTSEEVTTYVEEIYYTTEVIQPQSGLTVRVYNQLTNPFPQRSDTAYNLCKTTTLDSIAHDWGGGDILGCGSDQVMIHYTGYITPTENITSLLNVADDGFFMSIDGATVINNWTLKGCSGNWNSVTLEAGRTYAIDAWFYEWGGGACSTLYYQSANNQGVVPASWYSNGAAQPMIHDPALLLVLQQAQGEYDSALASYTTANDEWVSAQAWQQSAAQASTDGYNSVIATAEIENTAYANLQPLQSTYDTKLQEDSQAQEVLDSAISAEASAKTDVDQKELALDDASSDYDIALSDKESKTNLLTSAQESLDQATEQKDSAQSEYDSAVVTKQNLAEERTLAQNNLSTSVTAKEATQAEHDNNELLLNVATTTEATAKSTSDASSLAYSEALLETQDSLTLKSEAEAKQSSLESATQDAYVTANRETKLVSFTEVQTILDTPEPTPPVEEGSKEIPAVLTAENLMDVNLDKVDPTELTEAQAEQLVEAALQTFETAQQGSPEYQQALDALYLAAEQDDIVLPEELAAIPGLQAATQLINFLGNAGADMSPKVREESKKIVVTAVVAAGVAVQAAAGAATSAAVSSSSSSGSSSRRTGK
jgi:hypothetical protein